MQHLQDVCVTRTRVSKTDNFVQGQTEKPDPATNVTVVASTPRKMAPTLEDRQTISRTDL